jgi:hypothetical protein
MKSDNVQATVINRANQLNPYHPAYWKCRGQPMPPSQYIQGLVAANKIKPADNMSNQKNPNKGTDGTNRQYDQAQGNRGKQMNPIQQGSSSGRTKH